jgi:uncharacterized phage protein (TIGR02220 family)
MTGTGETVENKERLWCSLIVFLPNKGVGQMSKWLITESPLIPFAEIIQYLNDKADLNFKVSSKSTRELIKARVNEGFSISDFKKVIDLKVAEWGGDAEWNKYLRPEILFGPKFQFYLNENE